MQAKDYLHSYQPIASEEHVYLTMMLDFLNAHNNAFLRSCHLGHFTASAWIINASCSKGLLMHHRKLNKWLQCGGHCDGDDNLARVAMKEATEESGISDLRLLNDAVFDIDIHLIPQRLQEPSHYHFDVRFLLQEDDDTRLQKNSESNELQWVDLHNISAYTKENSILRMVRKTLNMTETQTCG